MRLRLPRAAPGWRTSRFDNSWFPARPLRRVSAKRWKTDVDDGDFDDIARLMEVRASIARALEYYCERDDSAPELRGVLGGRTGACFRKLSTEPDVDDAVWTSLSVSKTL